MVKVKEEKEKEEKEKEEKEGRSLHVCDVLVFSLFAF